MRTPKIEVADLRPLDADDTKNMSGWDAERARLARRDNGFGDFRKVAPRGFVKRTVVGRQLVDGVDDDRRCIATLCRVSGSFARCGDHDEETTSIPQSPVPRRSAPGCAGRCWRGRPR